MEEMRYDNKKMHGQGHRDQTRGKCFKESGENPRIHMERRLKK